MPFRRAREPAAAPTRVLSFLRELSDRAVGARRQAAVHVTDIDPGDKLLGTTLVGRYRIEAPIGAGAMGAVYRAQQVGLRRPVALKVLKKQAEAGSDVIARFEREAKALSALTHPNTVRVYDFGTAHDGLLFLAMELLEGELATTRLAERGPVPATEAIEIVQQVLRSIGEAHGKGIIHRDIKPDNIFLARVRGEPAAIVKVLDFGIAKSVSGEHKLDQFETLDGSVFGTPRYMSPEQAQGKALDHRSDLYAVGIVLYELLVGAPPFVDKDAVVVMAKHIREQPLPLRRAAPMRVFPESLQLTLDRALGKEPETRFQSAWEFERALVRCLRDAELLERTPARGQKLVASALRAPRWAQWAAMSSAGVLFAATAAALVTATTEAPAAHSRVSAEMSRPPETTVAAAHPTEATQAARPAPRVTLYSDPTAANVWREGRFVGVTPLALEVPQGRALRVEVSREGFERKTLDLAPSEGARTIVLQPAPAETKEPAEVAPPAEAALTPDERPRGKRKLQRAAARKPEEAYEKF